MIERNPGDVGEDEDGATPDEEFHVPDPPPPVEATKVEGAEGLPDDVPSTEIHEEDVS